MITVVASAWLAILVGGWLGWQLVRQNGRLLLRVEELEKRLDELEFGEPSEISGLPLGSLAPTFELPGLAGQTRTLADFRGQSVLLIFFNPACGFCRELLPKLATASPSVVPLSKEGERRPLDSKLTMLFVSTGDAETNRQLFTEHQLNCPVLLQKEMEVAAAYRADGTPSGYLISPEGKIASGLAIGAESLLEIIKEPRSSQGDEAHSSAREPSPTKTNGEDQSLVTGPVTANRFKNHSLARSKIKRDGLKAGTPAPNFRLPRLDGRGELTLEELRGRRVLLAFSDPHCGPCNALAPELERFCREQRQREVGRGTPCAPQGDGVFQNGAHGVTRPTLETTVVMISKGDPRENRAKVKEHGLTFPVVLQQQWEISRRYAMFATPVAYLIDEAGIIAHDVAVGLDAILALMENEIGA